MSQSELAELVALEHQYSEADNQTRRKMRRLAIAADNHLHSALLYSNVDATAGMLQQALNHYTEAKRRGVACHPAQYLQLRQQLTQARLQHSQLDPALQQRLHTQVQQQNQQLQDKIAALTGLERELSDQRSLPR